MSKRYGFKALVSVDGFDFPEPSQYSGNTSTIVDGGRNVGGYTVGAVVRDDVAKVSLKWNYLSVEDWSSILKCFKSAAGGKFINSVTFFDQTEGMYQTRELYISDRSASLWRRDPITGDVMGWVNCSLSLVEV